MFCPNCGEQNSDDASTCQRCGFKIKGAAAPRFKGTVLMMNPQESLGNAPKPAGAVAPAGAPAPVVSSEPQAAGPAVVVAKPRLKGTMIGVAPPGFGEQKPVSPQEPSAPVAPVMEPARAPGSRINPLGGTMVADPNAVAALGYGQPQSYGQPQAREGVPATLRGAQGGATMQQGMNPQQATIAFSPGMSPNIAAPMQAPPGQATGGYNQSGYGQAFPGASGGYGSSPSAWSAPPPQVPTTNIALTWLLAIITLGIYPLVQWLKKRREAR